MKKKLPLLAAVLALGLALAGCGSGDDPGGKTNPGVPATAIAAGRERTIAVGSDGKVRATGWNDMGQLGLGDTTDRNVFSEVTSLNGKGITAIAAGDRHTVALGTGGKVWATGHNSTGQLGLGDWTDRDVFTEVTGLNGKGIIAIAAGDMHTIALGSDGTVWATGRNDMGILGLGDTAGRNTFTEVIDLNVKGITAIAAGDYYTIALGSDGTVWATGYNDKGALGLGGTTHSNVFMEVTGLNGKNITAIAAGYGHTVAFGSSGKVWATGQNQYSELGLGDTTDRNVFTEVISLNGKGITAIATGYWHTIALGSGGKVWAAGYSPSVGLGDYTTRNTFTEVIGLNGKGITAIAAGQSHTIALGSSGKVWATGYNNHGELGLGDITGRNMFTEVTLH